MTRTDRQAGTVAPLARAALAAALALPSLALPVFALPAAAQVPAAKPAAAPSAKPAPAPAAIEAAKVAWEAMRLDDRVTVQDGLVWTGDYAGALDGTFGRMTFEAITAFQTRHKLPADGIVTAPFAKILGETATAKKTAVGFQAVDDKATGVRIHLPTRLLGPAARREAGTRWVGREGKLQVDTYAFDDGDLAALYERMKAEQPGRRITYAVLRPDWFVVADDVGGRRGYTRFARGPQGGIRGFLFTIDAALGPELDRVVIATAGRFEPFPGTAAPQQSQPTPGPQAQPTTPTTPSTPSTQTPTAVAVETASAASGLVVAPGKVVTAAAAVAGCRSLAVGGRPATIATPDAGGLATLAAANATASGPLRLAAAVDGAATVLATGDTGGRIGVVAVPGEAAEGRLRAALQRGGQGGVVVTASGGIAGLVAGRPDESRTIAGLVPSAAYAVIGAEALAAAVRAAGGTVEAAETGAALTTGRIVATWAARVVAIECRR